LLKKREYLQVLSVLEPTKCKHLLDDAENFVGWRVAGGEALSSRLVNVPSTCEWLVEVENALISALADGYPIDCSSLKLSEAAVVRYSVGATVPQHTDTNPAKRDRILSCVLYLTESFEGGIFHVPRLNFRGIAPLGKAIVFPSDEPHFAEGIVEGDKSVLVGFFEPKMPNDK